MSYLECWKKNTCRAEVPNAIIMPFKLTVTDMFSLETMIINAQEAHLKRSITVSYFESRKMKKKWKQNSIQNIK